MDRVTLMVSYINLLDVSYFICQSFGIECYSKLTLKKYIVLLHSIKL